MSARARIIQQHHAILKDIGNSIAKATPDGSGFLLMMFEFGEGGNMHYVSNARREDVLKMLDEFKQKLLANKPGTM